MLKWLRLVLYQRVNIGCVNVFMLLAFGMCRIFFSVYRCMVDVACIFEITDSWGEYEVGVFDR